MSSSFSEQRSRPSLYSSDSAKSSEAESTTIRKKRGTKADYVHRDASNTATILTSWKTAWENGSLQHSLDVFNARLSNHLKQRSIRIEPFDDIPGPLVMVDCHHCKFTYPILPRYFKLTHLGMVNVETCRPGHQNIENSPSTFCLHNVDLVASTPSSSGLLGEDGLLGGDGLGGDGLGADGLLKGEELFQFCPFCGNEFNLSHNFCGHCGIKRGE